MPRLYTTKVSQCVSVYKTVQKLLSSLLPGLYFFCETKDAIYTLLSSKSARNPGHYRLFVSTGTRPGQMQKFRDCPGHSGTLGNYENADAVGHELGRGRGRGLVTTPNILLRMSWLASCFRGGFSVCKRES